MYILNRRGDLPVAPTMDILGEVFTLRAGIEPAG